MSVQANLEVLSPRAVTDLEPQQTFRLTNKVKKAIESWHVLPLDLVEHTCKYLRLSDINALGTSHPYFAHMIFGRKRPLPVALVPDHENFQRNLRPDFSVQQSAESDSNLHQVGELERKAGLEKMGQIPGNFCGRVLGDPYHPFIIPAAYRAHLEARNTLKTPLTYKQYQLLEGVYRRFDQTMEPSLKIGYLDMWEADLDDETLHRILEAFPKPIMLNLRDNPKLTELTPLENRTFLQYLDLSRCKQISQLDPLKNCKSLRQLCLEDCAQITDLTALTGCTHLQKLRIAGTGVSSLEPLSRLFFLTSLNCKGCLRISGDELGHLQQLSLLESLDTDIAVTDRGLNFLGDLVSLRHLFLTNCTEVTNGGLLHLERLPRLRSLLLGNASHITNNGLTHLGRIISLRDLTILNCGKISDFGLLALIGLPVLDNLTIGPSDQISQVGLNFLKGQEFLTWKVVSH